MDFIRFAAPAGLVLERSGEVPDEIVLSFPLPREHDDAPRLTAAERAVLREVARGLSNPEIASRRGVSVRTVANQLAHLFQKLGVHSRLDALRVAGHRLGVAPNAHALAASGAPLGAGRDATSAALPPMRVRARARWPRAGTSSE